MHLIKKNEEGNNEVWHMTMNNSFFCKSSSTIEQKYVSKKIMEHDISL